MKFLIPIVFLFWTVSAFGNTLERNDYQRLRSLKLKLSSAAGEIVQVMEQMKTQKSAGFDCLVLIYDEAYTAEKTVDPAISLVALSVLMRDRTDELSVLRVLNIYLKDWDIERPRYRKTINRAMAQCASLSIVTAKGQNILGIIAELDTEERRISAKIAKSVSTQK